MSTFAFPTEVLSAHIATDSSSTTSKFTRRRSSTCRESVLEVHSLLGALEPPFPTHPPIPAVVVVDPLSTGKMLATLVQQRGLRLVTVASAISDELVTSAHAVSADATIVHDSGAADAAAAMSETLQALRSLPFPVVAVVPGGEMGVELADTLSSRLGLRTNGEEVSAARRNKYLMGERVHACGLRAAKQRRVLTCEEAAAALAEWALPEPFELVVKPINSAASEDVLLCTTAEAVRAAVAAVSGKVNRLGYTNEGALLQEYLDGTEYVVDSVSCDGVHKQLAVWAYDKRPANGAPFVQFSKALVPGDAPPAATLIPYARAVLTALGIRHGPSHMEVKMTRDGPCLVEVGARCHGGGGIWRPIVDECLGYNQVDAALDAYIRPEAWAALPARPGKLLRHGVKVDLVSYRAGQVAAAPGMAVIRELPSFRTADVTSPGGRVQRSVNFLTLPGYACLVNEDARALAADVARIRELEFEGLLVLEGEK